MAPPRDSSATVRINGSVIIGRAQPATRRCPKALDRFYGVPYASAPRFQRPVPIYPDSSPVRDLSSAPVWPPPPPELNAAPAAAAARTTTTTEDQLRLWITRPGGRSEGDRGGPMPVVVFFHGGSFNFGHPLDSNMATLVAQSARDLVTVGVEYRLGPLGFGPGDADRDGELNVGLWDQRVALEWVARWIGEFGGDGKNVTTLGVSAGAHSIGHQMLQPKWPPVFARAVLESGSPTARLVLSAKHPRTVAQFKSFRDHLQGDSSPEAVSRAGLAVWQEGESSLTWPFQPVVEDGCGPDVPIPETPLELWRREGRGRLPAILTGFCSHEGVSFVPAGPQPPGQFRKFFGDLIPGLDLDALERVYPPDAAAPATGVPSRLVEAYSHFAYICPILHTAHEASLAGCRIHLYEYAGRNVPGGLTGHCAHDVVVRPPGCSLGVPGLDAANREMSARWAAFAAGAPIDGSWPAFETPFGDGPGEGKLLVFAEGNDEMLGGSAPGVPVRTRIVTQREKEVCRFWWANMHLSEGMGGGS